MTWIITLEHSRIISNKNKMEKLHKWITAAQVFVTGCLEKTDICHFARLEHWCRVYWNNKWFTTLLRTASVVCFFYNIILNIHGRIYPWPLRGSQVLLLFSAEGARAIRFPVSQVRICTIRKIPNSKIFVDFWSFPWEKGSSDYNQRVMVISAFTLIAEEVLSR